MVLGDEARVCMGADSVRLTDLRFTDAFHKNPAIGGIFVEKEFFVHNPLLFF